MKIVIITLVDRGGMVHYTSQLANALSVYGEVTVIIGDGYNGDHFEKGIIVHPVELPHINIHKILSVFNFIEIIKKLREISPDVIHISGNHYFIFGLYMYLKNKNVVLTLHDVTAHIGEQNIINNLTNKLHINVANYIFVHGEELRNMLVVNGYPEKSISVIKHGDYSFFTKHKKNISEDGSILFFGRIVDYKGIEYLIKAVPLIKEQIPDVKVVIAGNGNIDKYTSLIKTPENFEIINEFIPDEQVAELFQRASIIVLPYIEASQTGIIPIAYSFKKPVIATYVGSIPEVVDNDKTGLLIPPRNIEALANAAVYLLQNDEIREQMGANAYKKMKNELSWDEIADETIEIYNNMIEDYKQ